MPPTVRSPISSQLMPNEVVMHRIDAIQIRRVSGCFEVELFQAPCTCFSEMAWLMK